MLGRCLGAAGIAVAITLGLLWVMQRLVSVQGELKKSTPPLSVEFVRLRKDNTPPPKRREPPKRRKPDQPPPPPDITPQKATLTQQGESIASIAPDIDTEDMGGGLVGGGSDRDIVPLVRIEPDYPLNARQRGIEGWVEVQFTVTKIGSVEDPVVLASSPSRIFDRAALQAVRKWKYNPKVEGGQPVARPGVRVRIDFNMED